MAVEQVLTQNFESLVYEAIPSLTDLYTAVSAANANTNVVQETAKGFIKLSTENFLLIGAILFFLSIIFSRTISRTGIPILALFLFVGFLAGEYGLDFSSIAVARGLGDFALIFILFYGGLETKFYKIRPILYKGIVLSTIGVLVTAGILGSLTMLLAYLFHWEFFTWPYALLLGSIVSSTDAASVFGIFRTKNLDFKNDLRPLLELESGSNDPMATFLTLFFLGLCITPELSLGKSMLLFLPVFAWKMLAGVLVGWAISQAAVSALIL